MSEPAARLSEHRIVADERLAQPHLAVSSDGAVVDGPHPLPHLPAGILGVEEEHGRAFLRLCHDDGERGAIRAGDEVLVAVEHPAAWYLSRRRGEGGRV